MPQIMFIPPVFRVRNDRHNNGVPVQIPLPMTDPAWSNYKDAVNSALRTIRSGRVGAALLDAFGLAGKPITIAKPIATVQVGMGIKTANACIAQGAGEFYADLDRLGFAEILRKAMVHINRGRLTLKKGFHLTALDAYAEMKKITECLANVTWENADVPWGAGWRMTAFAWKNDECQRLAKYIFERFLTPNTGVSSVVQWDHDNSSGSFGTVYGQKERWGVEVVAQRPACVGLAHELIHAWRSASGRGIFPSGSLEDEHMTVGLLLPTVEGVVQGQDKQGRIDPTPKFTSMAYRPGHQVRIGPFVEGMRHGLPSAQFTENAIRSELGQPPRPVY